MLLDLSTIETAFTIGVMWVSLEAAIFTVIYRITAKRWWWYKSNKPWVFKLSPNSWGFEGQGNNPYLTLKKLADDIMGKNRSLDERIDDKINRMIDVEADRLITAMLESKNVKRQLQHRIFDSLKLKLKEKMR